jgi:hypothetical protein
MMVVYTKANNYYYQDTVGLRGQRGSELRDEVPKESANPGPSAYPISRIRQLAALDITMRR